MTDFNGFNPGQRRQQEMQQMQAPNAAQPAVPPAPAPKQEGQQQPATQQQPSQQTPQQQQAQQGLPPTGAQRQAATIQQQQAMAATMQQPETAPLPMGQTSLQQMANRLAQSYGIPVGRQGVVDAQGNLTQAPDQLAGDMAAQQNPGRIGSQDYWLSVEQNLARFQMLQDAIQRQQQQQMLQKSEAALQAGLGLVGRSGRGSLSVMQQGYYQGLAQLYQQQQYEAADYSYFIQIADSKRREAIARAAASKKKKGGALGVVVGAAEIVAGVYTGNAALIGAGVGGVAGGGSDAGWW